MLTPEVLVSVSFRLPPSQPGSAIPPTVTAVTSPLDVVYVSVNPFESQATIEASPEPTSVLLTPSDAASATEAHTAVTAAALMKILARTLDHRPEGSFGPERRISCGPVAP